MRKIYSNILIKEIYATAITYPSPSNLNALWSFGSLGLFFLVVQIITGILLAMYYVPNADMAFASVDFIMREVNYGCFFVIYMQMVLQCFF